MNYSAAVEAILFVAGEAVDVSQLAIALELSLETIHTLVGELIADYQKNGRGIAIVKLENSYQMCSCQAYFPYIQKLYEVPQKKFLSQTLLETLAIIAYRQPITKSQIEDVRGVTADHAVNRLVDYGLVCEKGRLETPGKPLLFGTTKEFLKYFGFTDLAEMPPLEESEQFTIEAYEEVDKL